MKSALRILIGVLLCIVSVSALAEETQGNETLQHITLDQWEQRVGDFRPSIVVVDYWATWCSTCLERFPKMIELQKKFASRDIQFFGVNLDDPNDAGSVKIAEQFLAKVGADFPQFHITDNLMKSFDRLDLLGIPVVSIRDREGNEVVHLTGDNPNAQFTDQDVEDALLQLLEEEPS